jgi:hypothetical protein
MHRIKELLLSAMLFVVALQPARAQVAPTVEERSAGLRAVEALSFLEGEWQGEGWTRMGPGEPERFSSHELVTRRLEGRILTIHGQHREPATDRMVHDAFAVLSWSGDGYRFSSYLADGREGEYRGRLEGDAFVWEIPAPGRTIRYTLRVEDGVWRETGAMSLDGEQWSEFFGMTLRRVP